MTRTEITRALVTSLGALGDHRGPPVVSRELHCTMLVCPLQVVMAPQEAGGNQGKKPMRVFTLLPPTRTQPNHWDPIDQFQSLCSPVVPSFYNLPHNGQVKKP